MAGCKVFALFIAFKTRLRLLRITGLHPNAFVMFCFFALQDGYGWEVFRRVSAPYLWNIHRAGAITK